jgi:hypothetical protein
MKGWVYVITNKAMPGLVKVGYSTKDPEIRASELNHTGSPHPYLVEYELLIDEPYQIEQKTHKLLSSKREAKEWFRCTPEEAVAAVKQIAGNRTITETYKRAEKAKAEALYQQELREKEAQLKRQQAEKEIENRLLSEESTVRQKYAQQLATRFPPRPFWNYWIGGSVLSLIGISMLLPKVSDGGAFILAAMSGAILGAFLQNFFEDKRKQSSSYISLEKQRDEEVASVRAKVVGVPARTDAADTYPPGTRAKLSTYVGADADEVEITRCAQRVERIVTNLAARVDCRKIAIATKVKMAVNAPKQNIVSMITTSYPGIITDKMAADIFDALTEP